MASVASVASVAKAVTEFMSAESKLDHVCAGSAPSAAPADAVQLAGEFLGE